MHDRPVCVRACFPHTCVLQRLSGRTNTGLDPVIVWELGIAGGDGAGDTENQNKDLPEAPADILQPAKEQARSHDINVIQTHTARQSVGWRGDGKKKGRVGCFSHGIDVSG